MAPHGRGNSTSVAATEEDERCEILARLSVGVLELLEDGARVHDEAFDFALVESGEGVVVRFVALVLKGNEQAREVPHLDGERTDVAAAAGLLGSAVAQSAVGADPAGFSSPVPADELVGAALGEAVKQGVVRGARRAAQIGL